jgi:5-methyltetrahydropteroyltriglutamate--homocysteine methyltransferase
MRDLDVMRTLPKDKELAAGVIDVRSLQIETSEQVADRMRKVLEVVPAERVSFTTDCGMKALPRVVAMGKLRSLVAAAKIVRAEL